jgi:Bacterial PH domain
VKRVPRASSSLFAFWALAGFAAILVGDAAIRLDWHLLLVTVAPAAFLVWAAWLVLYRPEIRFDADRVLTVNPGRTIEVPWSHVSRVEQRPQLVLELDDGSRVTCWGAPFPEKPGLHRPVTDIRRSQSPRRDVVGVLEAQRRATLERTPKSSTASTPVTRRWDVAPLALGGALLVAAVAIFALTR